MTQDHYKYYTYKIIWSEEDGEYVGLCTELPSISFLSSSQTKALSGIIKLAGDIVSDMKKNKEEIPIPFSKKRYSGKFMVRTTPEQHRMLIIKAQEQGVSLNRFINHRLSD